VRRRTPPGRPSLALLLLAALAACDYDTDDYRTPTDPAAQYLQLSIVGAADSLPADGVSRLTLEARVSPDSTQRQVQFTTSLGTLVGGTGTDGTARQVEVDSSGVAQVELQSARQVGTARVTASVVGVAQVAQSLDVRFVAADAGSVLRFVAAPAAAPADGATASRFTVEVSPEVDPALRTVTFTTTLGSFTAGAAATTSAPVPVDAEGRASVLLYSPPAVGEALVAATVAGTSRQTAVRFERALPETLLVDLSKLSVEDSLTDSITLTVTLLRDVGTVTDGTVVRFAARGPSGAAFGLFDGITASGNGTATATFTPAGSGVRGTASFEVSVAGGASTSVPFEVVAPSS
jgi:hypothetical protein